MTAIRYRYQTIEFGQVDIHVKTLRDTQQFYDPDDIAKKLGISSANWALYGVIWASSKVLADLMSRIDIKNKRILEVGCGIGLASLILNHRKAQITATDYHPEAESLLSSNTDLNDDNDIPFERVGWNDATSELGQYDLIIGSDLLYEQEHAEYLSSFIDQHANPHCEVIIVDPGRGFRGRFKKHMVALGYVLSLIDFSRDNEHTEKYKGQILRFLK